MDDICRHWCSFEAVSCPMNYNLEVIAAENAQPEGEIDVPLRRCDQARMEETADCDSDVVRRRRVDEERQAR
jgi:hypothetical protein